MSRSRSGLALLAFLVGCGGSVATGDNGDAGGSDDTSSSGSDTSTFRDAIGSDGARPDGTTIDGGSTDTSTGGDSTVTNPGDGGIACGSSTCDPATQTCCLTFSGGGGSAKCIDKGGTCSGATIDCTNAAACPVGEICCANRDPTGGFSATCTADCGGGTQLCATDAECKRPGDVCRPAFGGTAHICRRPGGPPDGGGFDTSGFDTHPPG